MQGRKRSTLCLIEVIVGSVLLVVSSPLVGQTASTGAIVGITRDATGAMLPEVSLELKRKDHAILKSIASDDGGRFGFPLLAPGEYELQASHAGFRSLIIPAIHVVVTETVSLELNFQVMIHIEKAQVSADVKMIRTDGALGRAVDETSVRALPLATRNFSQITALSPGVASGVNNAGELGNGATALSQIGKSSDGIFAHGARSYDNNWQLDSISVSDGIGTGNISGGIPLPNPDALQEFKVQTGMYDAAFGRAVGTSVSVVSKLGGPDFHGSLFEYLRNDALNANDYFLKQVGHKRPVLRQNQFGFAIGGPIARDRAHFFGSYQGTRQTNGLATGQGRIACSASLIEPPLTNDRSQRALGQLFAGMSGQLGGVAIKADGSNINPAALALLNYKSPNGSFLVPTPQTINRSKPFFSQGFSDFTAPCSFNEDQFLSNIDFTHSQRSQFVVRTFVSESDQNVTFVGNGLNPDGNTPGFTSPGSSDHVVVSLAHSFAVSASVLNQAQLGFVRGSNSNKAQSSFKWSDIGVAEGEMNSNNELPSLNIAGSLSMTSAFPRTYTQNSFVASDNLSLLKGRHLLKLGGSLSRGHYDTHIDGGVTSLRFLSWPDFLLGLDGSSNGTGAFSNVFSSGDAFGLLDRQFRVWDGSAFVQDDYRIRPSLTLNLGLRYERIGQFGDDLGRNSSFDFNKANRKPPPGGSLDGYQVASNFMGTVPPGVARLDNSFANYGNGQNAFAPRVGLAWQMLPNSSQWVLKAGYGIYYSRPPAQTANLTALGAPFGATRINTGAPNVAATFENPFAQPFPTLSSFPLFVPYSPSTNLGINSLAPNFRPALIQQFALNVQTEVFRDWLLEVGYVGTRGTHLQRFRSLNQALNATPSNPINGETTNTLQNVRLRVPVPGIRPDSLREMESEGQSWYNGLEASATKRFSHGFQLLASYTFSKTLDTDGSDVNSVSSGNALTLGDQNSPKQRWGRASFDRTHRLVISGFWDVPSPQRGLSRAFLGSWSASGIATIQSGAALTIAFTNSTNVFGISQDRAQLSGTCSNGNLVSSGSLQSNLSHYFNASCFTSAPVVGADGIGTAFGNSGTGIMDGPGQANLDFALIKTITLGRHADPSRLQFRMEFFNALNHSQFANPDTNFSSPTFGIISSTSVNSRVGQLAIKLLL